jgi:hemoglobin/transferrin/lactoferrin receptor protein
LIPGVRADRYRLSPESDEIFIADNPGIVPTQLNETAVSPKLGALYKLREGLSLQAQYAEGYRAPPYSDVNVGFTNLQFGYTAIPNSGLKSESSRSVELGIRADGPLGFVDLVTYSNRYADFIESFVFVGIDPNSRLQIFQSQNLGSVKIRGTELRGRLFAGELTPMLENFELRAALASSHGDDRTSNVPLLSIDPAKAVLGLAYSAPSWRVELIGTAVKRKGRVADPSLFRSPGYGSLDLLAQWRFSELLSLDVAVFNLADRSYFDWSDVRGRPATDAGLLRFSRPGRNVSAALNFNF